MKCFIEWLDGSGEAVGFKTLDEARKALSKEERPQWSATWGTGGALVALVKNMKGETVDTAVISPEKRVILHSDFKSSHVWIKIKDGHSTVDPKGGFWGFSEKQGIPGTAEIMLFRRGVKVLTAEGEHWDTFED